jgi:tricorn protease
MNYECRQFVAVGLLALVTASSADAGVAGYYRFPAIHAERVVFAAEGDLWSVSTAGGPAMRLTTHAGSEAFPRFSPDGQWLAFSAEYAGNVDVYVMPADGGEPRRLTYHPGAEEVITWRPDSRAVVFRAQHDSPNGEDWLYEVPRDGGQPRLLPVGVAALATFSPDGRFLAFNPYSDEFRNWKRYLGGTAQDIWVGDLTAGSFRKLTDWPGTDTFPMWYADRVYFASDRDGRMNLYAMLPDGGDVRPLTRHDEYDVRWPDLDAGRIVYMYGGDLWLLDVRTGEDRKIDITLPTDRVCRQPRVEDASKTLESYDLDDDGNRLLVSAHGELWITPTKPGRIIQLTRTSGIRERSGVFSADGKHVACITDQTGEQEIAIFDAAGKEPPRILTHSEKGWLLDPVWSPDGKKLAYADLTQTLFIVDVESGASTRIDASDVWEISEYEFSPDGKWLAYIKQEANQYQALYLCDVADQTTHRVTAGFSDDSAPAWDPQGKYLYFLSARSINPVMDTFDAEHISPQAVKPCIVILAKGGKSPLLPEELLGAPPKPKTRHAGGKARAAAEEAEGDKDTDAEKSAELSDEDDQRPCERAEDEIVVDLEGIERRVVELPVDADNYSDLRAVAGKLVYVTAPLPGLLDQEDFAAEPKEAKNVLHVYDFKHRKDEVLLEAMRDYTLSRDGERIAYRVKEEIVVADLDAVKEHDAAKDEKEIKEQLDPAHLPLLVDPAAEWGQILNEAWRLQRDFYWAENMANVDWPAMRERYGKLLPRIGTRQELNDLIGQLIGELGTSHTYVWGGEMRAADHVGVGLLGADLEPVADADAFRFVRVLRPETWETDVPAPLTLSHANVHDGEFLLAINGRPLGAADNVYARLADLAGRQVLLTVGPNADRSEARDIQIETLSDERPLRYRDWCRRNREYVAEKTGGRVGYLHLPDMGGKGLAAFIRGFYPQINTDGLIIDARYNAGGFVSQMIIERLARRLVGYERPRRGQTSTYPERAYLGYKVVLVNEHAGSDGDIFPAAFQTLGLGPVIGTRTWGGVNGIRGDKFFIDGGLSTQPEFAFWDLRHGWGIENHGVEPDIAVPIRPEDWVAGRDPQLDRGLAEIERSLADKPIDRPVPPPIPDKSRLRR